MGIIEKQIAEFVNDGITLEETIEQATAMLLKDESVTLEFGVVDLDEVLLDVANDGEIISILIALLAGSDDAVNSLEVLTRKKINQRIHSMAISH